VATFYDARGHVIRTLNPDGSEQRIIFGVPGTIAAPNLMGPDSFEPTPWEAYTYDANDNAGRTHPAESATYQHHWNTPTSILIDPLGRTIEAVARNRDPPANLGDPLPPMEVLVTRTAYDIRGNVLTITDALGRPAFHDQVYDYANRKLRVDSVDAGLRKTVLDAMNGVIEQRDGKGALILHGYDNLSRPLRLWARDGEGQNLTVRQKLEYGDSDSLDQPDADRAANKAANRLGNCLDTLMRPVFSPSTSTISRATCWRNATPRERCCNLECFRSAASGMECRSLPGQLGQSCSCSPGPGDVRFHN
jgi:hypothetical protein